MVMVKAQKSRFRQFLDTAITAVESCFWRSLWS